MSQFCTTCIVFCCSFEPPVCVVICYSFAPADKTVVAALHHLVPCVLYRVSVAVVCISAWEREGWGAPSQSSLKTATVISSCTSPRRRLTGWREPHLYCNLSPVCRLNSLFTLFRDAMRGSLWFFRRWVTRWRAKLTRWAAAAPPLARGAFWW
jgi:hypothetical protein